MSKDSEQMSHKNIELLRFYISRDIGHIEKKIESKESTWLGLFFASFVDILVVVFIDDLVKDLIKKYIKNTLYQVGIVLLIILLLIVVFLIAYKLFVRYINSLKRKLIVSGEYAYRLNPEDRVAIDNFDNIACDGLLICQYYIQKYNQESEHYLKEFYYYEVIHHLEKARLVFVEIYNAQSIYIASKQNNYNAQLIDSYRINNFIDFFKRIYMFLEDNLDEIGSNPDLSKDMINIKSSMNSWKTIE